jgi:hypothetical protein
MVAFGAAYVMAEDDRSGARSPPSDGGAIGTVHSVSRREAEQRRIRVPRNNRQLAAPHFREQRLQGRRRLLAATLKIYLRWPA